MMKDSIRENKKTIYYKKPKTKMTTREDPLSRQLKHRLLLQVNYLSENVSSFQTHSTNFIPIKKNTMHQTATTCIRSSGLNGKQQENMGRVLSLRQSQRKTTKNCSQNRPYSVNNVRQLLKKRKQMKTEQNFQLSANPFYKIQKKRPRSLVIIKTEPHELLVNSQLNVNKIATEAAENGDQYPSNCQPQEQLSSIYPSNDFKDGEFITRGKSQSKIYEEIKKYFQDKYGQIRKKSQEISHKP